MLRGTGSCATQAEAEEKQQAQMAALAAAEAALALRVDTTAQSFTETLTAAEVRF